MAIKWNVIVHVSKPVNLVPNDALGSEEGIALGKLEALQAIAEQLDRSNDNQQRLVGELGRLNESLEYLRRRMKP